MFKFHKILMLSNKNKYVALITILIVSAFITVSVTQSFIAEYTGLPTLFIIGVLQVLFLIQYLFIRLMYREELLLLNQDSLHLFVIGKVSGGIARVVSLIGGFWAGFLAGLGSALAIGYLGNKRVFY